MSVTQTMVDNFRKSYPSLCNGLEDEEVVRLVKIANVSYDDLGSQFRKILREL